MRSLYQAVVLISAVYFINALMFPAMAQTKYAPSDSGAAPLSSADEERVLPDKPVEDEVSWLDKTESYVANTVHDFSVYVDQGLAKQEEEQAITNRSYVQFRSLAEYSHLGDFESDGSLSVRIDLPHIEHNWHLVFETDSDDYSSLESKQRDLQGAKDDAGDPVGGVEYQNGLLHYWDTNFGIGMKLRLPLDPFVRGELKRVEAAGNDWVAQFRQQLFYYHTTGGGSFSELKFFYPVAEDESQIFSAGSSAQYRFDEDAWELLFQLGLSDRINRDHLLDWSAGMSIDPSESDKVTNYWISATWSQNVHKNWLYFSIIPKIELPREYDYKANPGIQMNVELFFSKNRSINRLNRSIPKPTRNRD